MTLPKPRKIKIERYIGGLSKYNKINNPIKLSANESALGPSPKAIRAFANSKNILFRYPVNNDCKDLRSKIEDANHTFIETVWNVGYRFLRT